jgi:hypothetical protein
MICTLHSHSIVIQIHSVCLLCNYGIVCCYTDIYKVCVLQCSYGIVHCYTDIQCMPTMQL